LKEVGVFLFRELVVYGCRITVGFSEKEFIDKSNEEKKKLIA